MKPAFESVNTHDNSSFVVRKFTGKNFSSPYHFHPEFELTLILNGSGKRYVGTHMQDYFPGDLVLLGPNVPHCWKTGDANKKESASIVLHFQNDFMGKDFFHKPEMNLIHQLLSNSNHGLHFTGDVLPVKIKMISLLNEKNSYKKFIMMLEVLHSLASEHTYTMLHKQNNYSAMPMAHKERMNNVIAYIVDNFKENISLSEAALKANMTVQAFCKYFKKLTRKTFTESVNDYRVDFAVRQLIHTDKSISQICFESGFNDVSNFHKTFKQRIKISPLNYRNTYVRKLA